MRFLRNLLILIILAYGSAYGYLWYETNNTINNFSGMMAPFARFDYDSFFVSPFGNEISVKNIEITPQGTNDRFAISDLRFFANQIGFLLISGQSLKNGIFPESAGIEINGLQFSMNSKVFTQLEAMAEAAAAAQPKQNGFNWSEIDALGCGDKEAFTIADYKDMGLKNINADFAARLDYDKIGDAIRIQMDGNFKNLFQFSINTDIDTQQGEMRSVGQNDRIPAVYFTSKDNGYHKLRNAYCATQNNTAVEGYVDRNIKLLGEKLGIKLTEQLTAAYREYLFSGGAFNFTIKKQKEVTQSSLKYYKPIEVLDLLGAKLTIGKTRIKMNELFDANAALLAKSEEKKKQRAAEKKAAAEKLKQEAETAAKAKAAEKAERKKQEQAKEKAKPVAANVANAEKYLNKNVEVTLSGNRVRSGLLEDVNKERIYLLMEVHGGTLTYPVQKKDIVKFRVLK